MRTTITCPCVDCLCVPICKFKLYRELIICDLVWRYLVSAHNIFSNDGQLEQRYLIKEALKPTTWRVDLNGKFLY